MSKVSQGINYAQKVTEAENRGRRRPRWPRPSASEIRAIRADLKLTQEAFADRFGFDLVSLRKWEQDRGHPEQVSCLMLRMIQQDSDSVTELIQKTRNSSPIQETA